MKQIWRYPLPDVDGNESIIVMPVNASILCIQIKQGINKPCIWALVDPNQKKKEKKRFRIYGTGHDIPDDFNGNYIGTFQMGSILGTLVWHLWEVKK